MYHFQKNGLFDAKLLNTLTLKDKPPLEDLIYLNFHETSWENLLIAGNFIYL